jgi:hypothetical protein
VIIIMSPGIIIVLGSPNDDKGNLFSVAVERCEAALRLLADRPGWKVLLTGGFGAHFNTTGTPVTLEFVATTTDEGVCRLDLGESRNHERKALARLREEEAGKSRGR